MSNKTANRRRHLKIFPVCFITTNNEKSKVELYILLRKKAPYTKREFELNDDCIYNINVISLKHFKATDILKNVENIIKNNIEITDEDIAALQLIAYTTYSKSKLELLKKTYQLVRKLPINQIEKEAIQYILDHT